MRPRPAAISRQRTAGIAPVAHHAQAEESGSSKTAGTPMRDKSRTAVVEQLARAPALLDPERVTSGAGRLLRDGLSLRGPVGFPITCGSPIQPETGDRRFADPTLTDHPICHRVTQAYLALCAEVDPTVVEAHLRGKTRSCCSFCQRGDVIIAGADQCAARQSGHAQTRLGKRRCEPGAGAAQLPALTCASPGGCPLRSSRAPYGSARTSRSLRAPSSTGTPCAR
jgi:hypothetical protein